jgi:hypothetical protein
LYIGQEVEYFSHAVEECGIISALSRLVEKILRSSSLTHAKREILKKLGLGGLDVIGKVDFRDKLEYTVA